MVRDGNGPKHRLCTCGAQNKRIDITPTPWAIVPLLGLGVGHFCLRRIVSYDTAKSVRFIYTSIYTASAMISPPFAPFSAPKIVVRCPSPSQSSSSISYALFDCCVLFCCSLAPRTLVMDARAVHRRAPPPPPLPSSLSRRRVIVASRVFPPYHLPPPPPPLHAMTLSPRCRFIVASCRRRLSRCCAPPPPPCHLPRHSSPPLLDPPLSVASSCVIIIG